MNDKLTEREKTIIGQCKEFADNQPTEEELKLLVAKLSEMLEEQKIYIPFVPYPAPHWWGPNYPYRWTGPHEQTIKVTC